MLMMLSGMRGSGLLKFIVPALENIEPIHGA